MNDIDNLTRKDDKLNRKASKLIGCTVQIHALLKCIVQSAENGDFSVDDVADALDGVVNLAKDANKMANKLEEMTRKSDVLRGALNVAEVFDAEARTYRELQAAKAAEAAH